MGYCYYFHHIRITQRKKEEKSSDIWEPEKSYNWEPEKPSIKEMIEERQEKARRKKEEETRQRQLESFCSYSDGVSREQFEEIVKKAEKIIRKRHISLEINGSYVNGTVESTTGLSTWDFWLNFNDQGHLTGYYYLYSDNDDSRIPEVIGDYIQQQVKELLN